MKHGNLDQVAIPVDECRDNNCVACHTAGMALNQASLTKAARSSEVRKMVAVHKAPVSATDADAIIACPVATKGAP